MHKTNQTDILIIGAGLAGLTAAASLLEHGKSVKILESRSRIGGRIQTVGVQKNQPIELGATWLGSKHKSLLQLLTSLGIEIFKQEIGGRAFFEPISTSPPYLVSVPESQEPSYRIKGGSYTLIDTLVEKVGKENIMLEEKVVSIRSTSDGIQVETTDGRYHATKVISTLPPHLLVNRITFEPVLPQTLIDTANQTHTWMDDAIKVAITFATPFWTDQNKSGTLSSHVGPIHEMYDHSHPEKSFFALMGFMNGSYFSLSKKERLTKVIHQLTKYYGEAANQYLSYEEKVWRQDEDTYHPYQSHILPHQNNGHKLYQSLYMNDRLILSGTETSAVFPGYMEGAVVSGLHAAKAAISE